MQNKRFKEIEEDRSWVDFQTRFKQLMDSHGYNLTDTSRLLNISLTSISRYFKDRGPDILVLWRIADKFNVTIDWLIGRTTDKFSAYTPEQVAIMEAYTTLSDKDRFVVDALLFNRHE